MTLSQIRTTLHQIHVSPVKTLGQNFLHDQNLARWIVDQAQIIPGDFVVEIGPGLGGLTEIVLERGARVLAIEKDTRLANFLRDRLRCDQLDVLNGDALKFEFDMLFSHRQVKLLGNLPYNISSALLLKFLQYPSPIYLWLLTLQKEVAMRLSAKPATPDYGALTLRTQLRHQVKYLRTLSSTVFFPRPDVESALVQILPRDPEDLPPYDEELLLGLIRLGFSQRRKQLRKLLRDHVEDWAAASDQLGVPVTARAEELSLAHWIALANFIAPVPSRDTSLASDERFPIVDENDQVVSDANRSDVHGNNFLHRAVHILIFNSAGHVYLQQRSRWKDRHPLKWDSSAAGHVSAGESYDETAMRDLQEELGISVPLQRIVKLAASERTDQEFIWLYRGKLDGSLLPNRAEIETGAFLSETVIDAWSAARSEDFAPGFIECWKVYRRNNYDNCTVAT